LKILVIPDVHLKPWMFDRAKEIMDIGAAENALCLMDIPDDWGQEYNLGLYEETFDAAIHIQNRRTNRNTGIPADRYGDLGLRRNQIIKQNRNREAREVLARDKDLVKGLIKVKPTFLGDEIPIEGDGNDTLC